MRTSIYDIQASQSLNDVTITDRMLYINETELTISDGYTPQVVIVKELEINKHPLENENSY
jgi:hypothetical protein